MRMVQTLTPPLVLILFHSIYFAMFSFLLPSRGPLPYTLKWRNEETKKRSIHNNNNSSICVLYTQYGFQLNALREHV